MLAGAPVGRVPGGPAPAALRPGCSRPSCGRHSPHNMLLASRTSCWPRPRVSSSSWVKLKTAPLVAAVPPSPAITSRRLAFALLVPMKMSVTRARACGSSATTAWECPEAARHAQGPSLQVVGGLQPAGQRARRTLTAPSDWMMVSLYLCVQARWWGGVPGACDGTWEARGAPTCWRSAARCS